jgi:hypothetical protein
MARKEEVKIGKRIKVLKNTNMHNYTVGGIYTIKDIDLSRGTCRATQENGFLGNNLAFEDFKMYSIDYASLLKQKLDLIQELDEIEKKLRWMEENNVKVLHEKSYQVGGIVNSLQGKSEKEMFTLINTLLG